MIFFPKTDRRNVAPQLQYTFVNQKNHVPNPASKLTHFRALHVETKDLINVNEYQRI